MPKITRPETIIEVGVTSGYYGPKKVTITFSSGLIEKADGKFFVQLSKRTTTQLINALKTQRKRKKVR